MMLEYFRFQHKRPGPGLNTDKDIAVATHLRLKDTISWKKVTSLYILLSISLMISSGFLLAQDHTFPFGSNGEIVYNTGTGTATVYIQGEEVIANAYAVVYNDATVLSSKDYTDYVVEQIDLSDDFGTGKKMVVNMSASGLPDMQQAFYAYEGKEHFFVEVSIDGNGEEVSSNYMAPLVSDRVDIKEEGDNRVLFVPFDNDTFIKYNSKSMGSGLTNTSSEVTAFYENNSRKGLVVGSVEHRDWKTGIKTNGSGSTLSELVVWGGYTEESITRDAVGHGTISGESVKSPKVFVGLFEDWRDGLDAYGKANAVAEPRYVFNWEEPTPFGWNSWGAVQTGLNLEKAKAVVDFFSAGLPKFRNGETAYIDLDSYWDNLVSGGLEGDFTNLISFVRYCKERGLKPGIYWAPFVDWGKSDRKVEGSSYNYSEVWTKVNGAYHDLDGARAMDPTHPATQKRIDLVIDKFKSCGFEMIKIDFIGHAAIEADQFYDPTVRTGMQAFRKGMEYLIDRLDDKMLVYAAISPNLATGPFVHSRRIACDAYADINATEYTLNSTTYGWWQTHIYNFIDADHLVFGNSSMGENRARLISGVINGTLITGDDFSVSGQWTGRAKELLQNEEILDIARNGVAFRPVEGDTEQGASEVFVNKIDDNYYVAVINYGAEKDYNLSLDRLGIEENEYQVKELFSKRGFALKGSELKVKVGTRDAAVYKLTKGLVNAVSGVDLDTVTLYPNPANKVLKVENRERMQSLKLFSLKGETLFSADNLMSTHYEMDMSNYEKGIYLLSLTEKNGKTVHYKIIKEAK